MITMTIQVPTLDFACTRHTESNKKDKNNRTCSPHGRPLMATRTGTGHMGNPTQTTQKVHRLFLLINVGAGKCLFYPYHAQQDCQLEGHFCNFPLPPPNLPSDGNYYTRPSISATWRALKRSRLNRLPQVRKNVAAPFLFVCLIGKSMPDGGFGLANEGSPHHASQGALLQGRGTWSKLRVFARLGSARQVSLLGGAVWYGYK